MFKSHVVPLSKAETRLLNQLARKDFELKVKTAIENQLAPEAKSFYVVQRFNHYSTLCSAMGWPSVEIQSSYRNLPDVTVYHLLDLLHECNPNSLDENTYREFMALSGALTSRLQQALGVNELVSEIQEVKAV